MSSAVRIPLIHIADATAAEIKRKGCQHPLLLATAYTMEQDFYVGRMRSRHEIDLRVPNTADRAAVHDVIFNELVHDVVKPSSKSRFMNIIDRERQAGADSVIFGCTEIGMLLSPNDIQVPCFDTALIHAQAAVDFALAS